MDNTQQNAKLVSWAVIAAAAVTSIGCFMPWLSATAPLVGTISKSGTDGTDGNAIILAVWFGAAVAVARLVRPVPTWLPVVTILAAMGSFGLAAWNLVDILGRLEDMRAASDLVAADIGGGMWLTLAGAAGLGLGGLLMLVWQPAVTQQLQARAPGGAAPGWYPDPYGIGARRWWDGAGWTENIRHAGAHQD